MKVNVFLNLLFLAVMTGPLAAQKMDSISFHLYTDSLKKGQHNYISVDGKLSNGRWMPLTSNEIDFSCPSAVFEGNDLVLPQNFAGEKVTVKAVLKANRGMWIEKTIWIKKNPDPALPTREEIMNGDPSRRKRSKGR